MKKRSDEEWVAAVQRLSARQEKGEKLTQADFDALPKNADPAAGEVLARMMDRAGLLGE